MATRCFYGRWRAHGKRAAAFALAAFVCWASFSPSGARAAEPAQPTPQPSFDDLDVRATPEETYAANAFSIVYIRGGGETWRPVRGIYRMSTGHDTFFRAAGRPDLAQRFSRRHGTGVLLEGLGTIAGYGGITVVFWGVFKKQAVTLAVGGSMVVAWPILHYLGNEMQNPELSPDDALALAGRYNDRLRERLQLAPPAENHVITADARAQSRGHRVLVAPFPIPYVTSGGGGLALVGRF